MNIMLYPMLTLVLWTFVMLAVTFFNRAHSLSSGQVSLGSYKLLDRGDLPERVVKSTRNYANLFEMPVLFYAGCGTALALGLNMPLLGYAAWAYVLLRIAHSVIHISYNNVWHRMVAFMLSNISLMILWLAVLLAAQ